MNDDTIEWRDIPGYEGLYQISSTGLVKRIKPATGATVGAILATNCTSKYPIIGLRKDNRTQTCLIHRLVMLAFVGKSELDVNHKNGIKTDNRLENLEYVTHRQNIQHSFDVLGRKSVPGHLRKNSKLNEKVVREIRTLYSSGRFAQLALAEIYGVSKSTIAQVVRKRIWKHIV